VHKITIYKQAIALPCVVWLEKHDHSVAGVSIADNYLVSSVILQIKNVYTSILGE
jgi:hypothetical protein